MKVHLMERVPGSKGALTVLELEFTSKARSVRVTTTEGLEPLDLRGERTGGTYDAAPTLTRLHVPLRVTADGNRSVKVSVTVTDAAGLVAAEAWEGTVRLESVRRKSPSMALLLGGFAAVAAGIGAFVILPMLRPAAVPSLVGKPQAEAERALKSLGFAPVVEQVDSAGDAGRVIAQVPAPDTQPPKNSPVLLRVGRRPTTVEVPQLVGRLRGEAEAALSGTGLQVSVTAEDAPDASDGRVLRQRPAAGNLVAPGTALELVVGRRRAVALRDVPDVTGLAQADALEALERAGLVGKVDPMAVEGGSARVGKVVEQTPAGGGRLAEGATVKLRVGEEAAPPAVAEIPNVVGASRADAERALTAAGFEPVVDEVEVAAGAPGSVASQDPSAGAARVGTRVTLRVARAPRDPVAVVPPAMGVPPAMAEVPPAPPAREAPVVVTPPAMAEEPPAPAVPTGPTAPDLRRLTRAQAVLEARRVGVRVAVTEVDVPTGTPDGIVLRQFPAPGAPLVDGGVALVVARAPAVVVTPPVTPDVTPPVTPPVTPDVTPPGTAPAPAVAMPDLVGLSRAAAEDVLKQAGVLVRVSEEDTGGETPEGLVLHQKPSAGEPVGAAGVEMVVARRGPVVPAVVLVPNVLGRPADDAVRVLRDGGYVPRILPWPTTAERAGLVLRQEPAASSSAPVGTSVVVYVGAAAGRPPARVPPTFRPPGTGTPGTGTPPPDTTPRAVPAPLPPAAPGSDLPPPRRLTRPGEALPPPMPPRTGAPTSPRATAPPSPRPTPGSVVPMPGPGTSGAPPPIVRTGGVAGPAAGAEFVSAPDFVGRDAAEAIEVALRAGLLPRVVGDRDARAAAGRVRMQSVATGTPARTGSPVTLQVGAGASPSMVDVPDVSGQSVEAAVARLSSGGFATSIVRVAARPGVFATGVVVAQAPSGRFAPDLARLVRLFTVER